MLQQPIYNLDKQIRNNLDYIDLAYNTAPRFLCDYKKRLVSSPVYQSPIKIFEQYTEYNDSTKFATNLIWHYLSMSPDAIPLLKKNPKYINWEGLSYNTSTEAIKILKENPDKIDWKALSSNTNPEAVKMLEQNPKKIDWRALSGNSSAVHILEKNKNRIKYSNLGSNINAVHLLTPDVLREMYHETFWQDLSMNPSAVELIEELYESEEFKDNICWLSILYNQNPKIFDLIERVINNIDPDNSEEFWDDIDVDEEQFWHELCRNPHPRAVNLVVKNIDKLFLTFNLSFNPEAVSFLKENERYIDMECFLINSNAIDVLKEKQIKITPENCRIMSKNLNIMQMIDLDYNAMKERNKEFAQELTTAVFNPIRLMKISETYNIDFGTLVDTIY